MTLNQKYLRVRFFNNVCGLMQKRTGYLVNVTESVLAISTAFDHPSSVTPTDIIFHILSTYKISHKKDLAHR